ncbi:hypothetical protein ACH5RR_021268 [Cinchona calisaya]|uniref:Reverse transcriptase domain-containing protein n=1 Tax=Cinchona calisaya TaxID=153742 RepID=A0ABD2ZHT6_9GENT
MVSAPDKRDRAKYCPFHGQHGHDTEACNHLKVEIEKVIQEGHLQQFISLTAAEFQRNTANQRNPGQPCQPPHQQHRGDQNRNNPLANQDEQIRVVRVINTSPEARLRGTQTMPKKILSKHPHGRGSRKATEDIYVPRIHLQRPRSQPNAT